MIVEATSLSAAVRSQRDDDCASREECIGGKCRSEDHPYRGICKNPPEPVVCRCVQIKCCRGPFGDFHCVRAEGSPAPFQADSSDSSMKSN
jgi:hypothetical protein